MKKLFFLSLFIFAGLACSKDQSKTDREIIEKYVADKGLVGEFTPEGVFVVTETEGTGTRPTLSSTVTVGYKGYFLDGSVFDESASATFPLSGVIEGWQIGIPKFKAGGKGILIIPSNLAYGSGGSGSIPGDTVLAFDVNLIKVQ